MAEEKFFKRLLHVSENPVESKRAGVRCMPWRTFVDQLWADRLL